MEIPKEVANDLGPWGYIIAVAVIMIATSISGGIAFLTRKLYSGAVWLCELLQKGFDKHFDFVEKLSQSQTNINTNLYSIARTEEQQKDVLENIDANTKATCEKLQGWDSDTDGICKIMTALRKDGSLEHLSADDIENALRRIAAEKKRRGADNG